MKLETVPISKLMEYEFNIPAYQRGYRWDNQQVIDLLNDLEEFSKAGNINSYYCLQPIVVKENPQCQMNPTGRKVYDVIDGQQRLTTIYILLSYLYPQRKCLQKSTCNQLFHISFEKRDDGYLNDKRFETDDKEYKEDINKFYIFNAYKTIEEWFKSRDLEATILYSVLGQKGIETDGVVKVIWYDMTSAKDTPIEIFTRLNYGKIPLLNAELIKALLLICDHYPSDEIAVRKETAMRMSAQWDEMENTLHIPYIWNMVASSEHDTQARIGLLINKVARDIKRESDKEQKENNKESLYDFSEDKEYFDYHIINRYLELNGRTASSIDAIWQKIQDAFTVIRNWASDREVYHYISYLCYLEEFGKSDHRGKIECVNAFIDKCFNWYLSTKKEDVHILTKDGFKGKLRREIWEKIKVDDFEKLSYNDTNKALIRILLLFNIEQSIYHKDENFIYPFDKQRKQNITSLEHIHPQNLDTSFGKGEDDFNKKVKPWLESKLKHLDGDDKQMCIEYLSYETFSNRLDDVKKFIEKIDNKFRDMADLTEDEMHSIRNMALVSKEVNSALSNNFHGDKRNILKEQELKGKYIPPATWMVFNKSFTTSPSNLTYWEKDDRDAYYKEIHDMYLRFASSGQKNITNVIETKEQK